MFNEKKKIVDLLKSKITDMNKKRGLELFLWALSIFFAAQIYSSINGPIKFNKVKNEKKKFSEIISQITSKIKEEDRNAGLHVLLGISRISLNKKKKGSGKIGSK